MKRVLSQDLDDSRPGRLGFTKAQDPTDATGKRRRTVWIVKSDLARKMKHQPWVAMNVETAFLTSLEPVRIYRGYRHNDDGGWEGNVYVGRPTHFKTDSGNDLPLPPRRLYVVYIKDNGDITEWGKEESDPDDPDAPVGASVDSRFKEQVWPAA